MWVVLRHFLQDFNQLLQPGLALLRSTKSGPQLYTHQMWAQEFNLPADQAHLWVDVRALSGDPGDNIPGVKGIGMLTALQLVREFGSVEQILEVVRNGQVQELAQVSENFVMSFADRAAATPVQVDNFC